MGGRATRRVLRARPRGEAGTQAHDRHDPRAGPEQQDRQSSRPSAVEASRAAALRPVERPLRRDARRDHAIHRRLRRHRRPGPNARRGAAPQAGPDRKKAPRAARHVRARARRGFWGARAPPCETPPVPRGQLQHQSGTGRVRPRLVRGAAGRIPPPGLPRGCIGSGGLRPCRQHRSDGARRTEELPSLFRTRPTHASRWAGSPWCTPSAAMSA